MGDFAPEDGPLVQQIALSGACGDKSERDLIPACVHVLHGMRDHKRN